MFFNSLSHVFFEFGGEHLPNTDGSVFSNRLDVVTEMVDPEFLEFRVQLLTLLWESADEMTAGQASAVSNWPRGILKAV